jgi:carbon storage regulator CsrA
MRTALEDCRQFTSDSITSPWQRSVPMLVLTRKAKQQIQIGPHVTITILQIKGQTVRLGIEAPRDVSVLRNELAAKPTANMDDPTVQAAFEKVVRENAISSGADHEVKCGRTTVPANGSLRCRAPRVDSTTMISPHTSTGPASFSRPRRRRLSLR